MAHVCGCARAAGDGTSHAEAVRRAWEVGIPRGPGAPRELVLQDISLAVRAGSLTVVVGEVGAGGCPHARSGVDGYIPLCALLCATISAWYYSKEREGCCARASTHSDTTCLLD